MIGGLVGATWYLRNLIEHGSPLWPFAGGDPQPPLFARLDHSLLQRPRTTLSSQARRYFESLGGAPVLFAAAVVAPALVRRPLVAWGALATACSVLLYAAGPVTGRPNVDELAFLPATTVRYLLPAIAAACATLALTAGSRRGRLPAQAVLAVATGLSLVATWPFGYPDGPSLVLAAAGALGGAGAAALVSRVGIRPVLAGAGLIAAVALTGASSGLVLRHAKLNANRFSGVSLELERRSGFKRSQAPVATNSSPLATLAGDRLDRRVDLIPARETCAEVERRLRGSWIILSTSPPLPTRAGRLVCPPRGLPAAWPPAGRTPAPELSGYAHRHDERARRLGDRPLPRRGAHPSPPARRAARPDPGSRPVRGRARRPRARRPGRGARGGRAARERPGPEAQPRRRGRPGRDLRLHRRRLRTRGRLARTRAGRVYARDRLRPGPHAARRGTEPGPAHPLDHHHPGPRSLRDLQHPPAPRAVPLPGRLHRALLSPLRPAVRRGRRPRLAGAPGGGGLSVRARGPGPPPRRAHRAGTPPAVAVAGARLSRARTASCPSCARRSCTGAGSCPPAQRVSSPPWRDSSWRGGCRLPCCWGCPTPGCCAATPRRHCHFSRTPSPPRP